MLNLNIMATKDKLMRLLQEVSSLAEMKRTQTIPKHSPLFLVQLRSHINSINQSRRRLSITADNSEIANFPHPVPITFLKTDSGV